MCNRTAGNGGASHTDAPHSDLTPHASLQKRRRAVDSGAPESAAALQARDQHILGELRAVANDHLRWCPIGEYGPRRRRQLAARDAFRDLSLCTATRAQFQLDARTRQQAPQNAGQSRWWARAPRVTIERRQQEAGGRERGRSAGFEHGRTRYVWGSPASDSTYSM